ncbi:hypothetical protein JNK13_07460 [bacterium]|nr:hypothetical protein [bacterium]
MEKMDLSKKTEAVAVVERKNADSKLDTRAKILAHLLLTSQALTLGFCLATLQALDGILTSIGVSRFGLRAEANPILRALMEQFGHIPTLTVVKTGAIVIVIALTIMAHKLPWLKSAMGALACFYILAAVAPWTYILLYKS